MTIKLSSKRPDEELNGLDAIADELVDEPHKPRLVVATVRPIRATREFEQDGVGEVPTVRLLHIEPMRTDDEIAAARKLLDEARTARVGGNQLALDDDED